MDTDDVGPQPPIIPAILDQNFENWQRCLAIVPGFPHHKVMMDHFTHQSGRQRAYINCLVPGHRNCFRWRFCDQEKDRHSFCAFMMAWAIDGHKYPGSDRQAHMRADPHPDDVEATSKALVLEDF